MPFNQKFNDSPLQVLSGPEIETLADYFGQGALGVAYDHPLTEAPQFHPLTHAYDDVIARSQNTANKLCMSTDSNRSDEHVGFPKRTCIEFRSGPSAQMTEELLHLVKTYSDWLKLKKNEIRRTSFVDYHSPSRTEKSSRYYLNISDFINYYNGLKKTRELLIVTSPEYIFAPEHAGPDFAYKFPNTARWFLELSYEDLAPRLDTVFYTQYNMSLPIGAIFSPTTRSLFPLATQFPLLFNEKEVAADFNTNRPHAKIAFYEQNTFLAAISLADYFFNKYKMPQCAIGAQDFLRGFVFEVAMISTSEEYLIELFYDDALWITQQRINKLKEKNEQDITYDPIYKIKQPTPKDLVAIAASLGDTLKKSLFSYFMKSTLAVFFKNLHPYEQGLLGQISKQQVKKLCQNAVNLANGGVGNSKEHPSCFVPKQHSFMDVFDDFYEQTFHGCEVDPTAIPADPIAFLTTRFIASSAIGTIDCPVSALVVEVRKPAQGNQKFQDIQHLCKTFGSAHQKMLADFYLQQRENQLLLSQLGQKMSYGKSFISDLSIFSSPKHTVMHQSKNKINQELVPVDSTEFKFQEKQTIGLFTRKRKNHGAEEKDIKKLSRL